MPVRKFPDYQRPIYDIAGLPFDAVNLQQAMQKILHSAETRESLFISTPNLNFLIRAQKDAAFRETIFRSDMCLADGMPIVWLARMMGVPIRHRVSGSDLFEALYRQSEKTIKVFFFGGPEGAAEQAAKRVNRVAEERCFAKQTPGVVCVGYESPGFGSVEDMSQPEMIQRINAAQADFVIVALGACKGQAWIDRNREQLEAPVISHLGAVVNMVAGTIARAPRWMQFSGLEWVWRIKEEPQLWRRYAFDGLGLIKILLSHMPLLLYRDFKYRLLDALHHSKPSIECQRKEGTTVLQIRGNWTHSNGAALRKQLDECRAREDKVVIHIHSVGYLDSAIRGLLAIAPKTPAA